MHLVFSEDCSIVAISNDGFISLELLVVHSL